MYLLIYPIKMSSAIEVFVQANQTLATSLPILYGELGALGAEFSSDAKNVLQSSGFTNPEDYMSDTILFKEYAGAGDSAEEYKASNVDVFSNEVTMNSTLTSIENDADDDGGEDWQDAWDGDELNEVLSPEFFEVVTDQFENDDDPDIDEGMPPLAERLEDVAPSDPISTTELAQGIQSDAAEADENLTGGIADVKRFGVEDANQEGPNAQNSENVHPISQSVQNDMTEEAHIDTSEKYQSQVANVNNLEKSDFTGDMGQDTAIQSALSISQQDFDNSISPFVPTPSINTEGAQSGIPANLNDDVINQAYQSFTAFSASLSQSYAQLNESYIAVKNVESEMMSIDNIALIRDLLLTPTERINKASSRIERLQGTKNILAQNIVKTMGANERGPFIAPMVALYALSDNMITALNILKSKPTDDKPLKYIETFVSPNLTFIAGTIEKLKIKQELADMRAKTSFSNVVSAYQNADSSERDISKVLRYDVDTSPAYSPFAIQMQKEFNHDIQSSLLVQRKIRSKLLAKTNMSFYITNKVIDHRTLKQNVKQAIDTMKINTDNELHKYPRLPFSTKTNSRRLNLLETPLAVKNRKSVPYINEFNKSKLLFS